ncbi:MAG: glutamate synthase [Geodermatophilaceae bacterium]|nr:glutamate synthase [Geodermatophilaceae bacterium]MDQ3465276.1 glutamate synthase [Actinomycetota bacterium]
MVTLSCTQSSVREINRALRSQPPGAHVTIVEPRGAHNLAVGLRSDLHITVEGNAGYYLGGLSEGIDVTVNGSVGWGVAENLMAGVVRVNGNASEAAAASAHGGTVIVSGDASLRAGISLKGGTLVVAGDVGNVCAFMAQAGTILVGGNAGEALGDSLYETVIYVHGTVRGLGADARIEELTEADVKVVSELVEQSGFDHIDPQEVTRVASARQLYNFDALKSQRY